MNLDFNTIEVIDALPVDYIDFPAPLFEFYQCSSGAVVLRQGKPADYLYCVIGGSVEISYKPYDGDPITVAHIEKGGWFGWSAAVGSKYYTSSAVAIEPLKAVRVRGSDFRRFCLENPEAGKDVVGHPAKSVSGRWKHANDQVVSILTQGMRES